MLGESSLVNCHVLSLQVTNLLKSVEFIFVPFVNPDGYVVSLHLLACLSPLFVVIVVCCFCCYCCFCYYCLLLLLLVFFVCCDGGIVSSSVYLEQ